MIAAAVPDPPMAESVEPYEGCIRCQQCGRIWYWVNVSYSHEDKRWLCDECREES